MLVCIFFLTGFELKEESERFSKTRHDEKCAIVIIYFILLI
jgi:hypothetical protein